MPRLVKNDFSINNKDKYFDYFNLSRNLTCDFFNQNSVRMCLSVECDKIVADSDEKCPTTRGYMYSTAGSNWASLFCKY